jgi:hydrogenase-4 membrane subunit HyfE
MLGSSLFKALPDDFKNTFMISLMKIVSQKNTKLSFLGFHLEEDERERILNVLSQK